MKEQRGAMNEWKPIESAPKDGSDVLCWRAGWHRPSFLQWRENYRTKTTFWNDCVEEDAYDLEDAPPTHWHPIAPVPQAEPMNAPGKEPK